MESKYISEEQGRNSKLDSTGKIGFQSYSKTFLKGTTERTEIFASSGKRLTMLKV